LESSSKASRSIKSSTVKQKYILYDFIIYVDCILYCTIRVKRFEAKEKRDKINGGGGGLVRKPTLFKKELLENVRVL
jgi:hypothetical protein